MVTLPNLTPVPFKDARVVSEDVSLPSMAEMVTFPLL